MSSPISSPSRTLRTSKSPTRKGNPLLERSNASFSFQEPSTPLKGSFNKSFSEIVTPRAQIIPDYNASNSSNSSILASNKTSSSSPLRSSINPGSLKSIIPLGPPGANTSKASPSASESLSTSLAPSSSPDRVFPQPGKTITKPLSGNPVNIQTGIWKHPALDTISRRTANKELLFSNALVNGGLLAFIYFIALPLLPTVAHWLGASNLTSHICKCVLYVLLALALFNAVTNLWAVLKPEDKMIDLPLDENQRKLLGLPPSPKPVPASSVVTPPKYSTSYPATRHSPRTSSPLSASGSPRAGVSPVANKSVASKGNSSSPLANKTASYSPTGRFAYLAETKRRSFVG